MSNQKRGLSICVPVYNKAPLIGSMLESIERQRIEDLEVVAVNNASTDDSLKILESWQDRLNIKIYTMPRTISLQENWLLALSLGTREFLKLQLADDIIPDGAIPLLLAELKSRSDIGCVVGNTIPKDSEGEFMRSGKDYEHWKQVNDTRRRMAEARTYKQKARLIESLPINDSPFGDANPLIFRSHLIKHLRVGIDKLCPSFQTYTEYEINLRLFAATNVGYVDVAASYPSYDENSSLPKLYTSRSFRRRSWDMALANMVVMYLFDPDLTPLRRQLSPFYLMKSVAYQGYRLTRFAMRSLLFRYGFIAGDHEDRVQPLVPGD